MDYVIDSTTEKLHSTGGIALAGKIWERIQLGTDEVGKTLKHPHLLRVLAGLFVQGRTRYEEVSLVRSDSLFQESLELPYVPAPETLRLYLEQMIDQKETVQQAVEGANLRLLQRTRLTPVQGNGGRYLPLDIDTTVLDNSKSHKEGVSRTYKQVDGYHPIMSYMGQEGYMLSCELREGKQHCQKGTPEYLRHTLSMAQKVSKGLPLLVRLDAGYDAQETLRVLQDSGQYFLVKRNPRKEDPAVWLAVAQAEGQVVQQDDRKTVFVGVSSAGYPGREAPLREARLVWEVTRTDRDEEGTPYLFPEISVQSFWTNLPEEPETVIQLYHEHGTSEQFHSELKGDMNIERLPSRKFAVNGMILQVAMVAFNTLRFIGQRSVEREEVLPVPPTGFRKRLRKVMDDLVRVAVKVVQHGRTTYLKLWAKDPWLLCFKQLYYLCCNL